MFYFLHIIIIFILFQYSIIFTNIITQRLSHVQFNIYNVSVYTNVHIAMYLVMTLVMTLEDLIFINKRMLKLIV